jgi:hypothetical protein
MFRSSILIIICINVGNLYGSEFQQQINDSLKIVNSKTDGLQESIIGHYDNVYSEIDTFAWSKNRINSGRIDCSYLFDTVRIVLRDTSRNQHYIHPFKGLITSDFGRRNSWLWHHGIDIKLNMGDSVRAAFDGIVRAVLYDRHGYGKVVAIRHCWGVETIYGHLSKSIAVPNHKVKAGDVIGLGGRTGRASGAHLHFETRYYGEPFDPNIIIDFENFRLKSDTLKLYKDDFAYLDQLRKIVTHKIKEGDNLSSIAKRYRTTINRLCSLNGITPQTVLRIGRNLIVRAEN